MKTDARPGTIDDKAGADLSSKDFKSSEQTSCPQREVRCPASNGVVAPAEQQRDTLGVTVGRDRQPISDPSSLGEGAGPLELGFLAGPNFQGGPASIRDPHGIFFLPPDQEPPAESIPRHSRLGRLMAAILSLRAIPLPRSRDVQPGAGVLPLASGCEFQCSHPNSFRRGFALGAGIMAAFWLATITDGAGSSLAVLGVSGAVVLASALSDKFLSSRAAASPKLSNSSGTLELPSASQLSGANAALLSSPNLAGPLAKVSSPVRIFARMCSLRLRSTDHGATQHDLASKGAG